MSRTQLAGVFGELMMLQRIISIDPKFSRSWTGPLGQRHDFSFAQLSIEVKATLSSQQAWVHINGIDQMAPAPGCPLYLAHYRLETAQGGQSVPDLVTALTAAGIERDYLYGNLARLNYFPEHEVEYAAVTFRLQGISMYLVAQDFPVLSRASFVDGDVPPAIVRVDYVLDLGQAARWKLSDSKFDELLQAIRATP
jgi:hypothetical protein